MILIVIGIIILIIIFVCYDSGNDTNQVIEIMKLSSMTTSISNYVTNRLPKPVTSLMIGSRPFYTNMNCMHISNKKGNILRQLHTLCQVVKTGQNQLSVEPFKYRNHFDLITVDIDRSQLYDVLELCKLLGKQGKDVIIKTNDMDFNYDEQYTFVQNVQNQYHHVKNNCQVDSHNICCSNLLANTIYDYISSNDSTTIYYSTSMEREFELRSAYSKDKKFEIVNITSGIHGCVLKCLFKNINVTIQFDNGKVSLMYMKCCHFVENFLK
jgi:hypothetical protein